LEASAPPRRGGMDAMDQPGSRGNASPGAGDYARGDSVV